MMKPSTPPACAARSRIVQDHAADSRQRRVEPKLLDLRRRRARVPSGEPRPARRRIAGDAPAPGIGRLAGAAVGIRQRVAGGHVHHHEGIEHDLEPARLQLLDQAHDALVGRRAAIGRARRRRARPPCASSRVSPATDQVGAVGRLGRHVDARLDRAGAGAQVVAEPAHHERHALEVRAQGLQRVERGRRHRVARCSWWRFSGRVLPRPSTCIDRSRVVAELARAGDQADGADHAVRARRPDARPRRRIAARGCRNRRAAGARTPHRRARDRPARSPRPPWRRSADRRSASRCPRCTRMVSVLRSSSRPSAQTRRTKAIGPSHRPTARLAK